MSGFRSKKVAALERFIPGDTSVHLTIRVSNKEELTDAVIKLHDIARLVTGSFHVKYGGELSSDIRDCADRLNELTR